jgi:hypothetical protein
MFQNQRLDRMSTNDHSSFHVAIIAVTTMKIGDSPPTSSNIASPNSAVHRLILTVGSSLTTSSLFLRSAVSGLTNFQEFLYALEGNPTKAMKNDFRGLSQFYE